MEKLYFLDKPISSTRKSSRRHEHVLLIKSSRNHKVDSDAAQMNAFRD